MAYDGLCETLIQMPVLLKMKVIGCISGMLSTADAEEHRASTNPHTADVSYKLTSIASCKN